MKQNNHCQLQVGLVRTITYGSRFSTWQKPNKINSWMQIYQNVKAACRVADVVARDQTQAEKEASPK